MRLVFQWTEDAPSKSKARKAGQPTPILAVDEGSIVAGVHRTDVVPVEAGVVESRGEVAHGERLGRWERCRREGLELTQEQVADRMDCGITGNWVTRLATGRGRNLVPQPTLGRLANALETDAIDLLYAAGMLPREHLSERVAAPNVARLQQFAAGLSDEHARNLLPVVRALVRLVDALEPGAALDPADGNLPLDRFPRRTA